MDDRNLQKNVLGSLRKHVFGKMSKHRPPDPSPEHEALESPDAEREEHATGEEAPDEIAALKAEIAELKALLGRG